MDEGLLCFEWEYHPMYGCFSRLVFRRGNKDMLTFVRREYRQIN